ncbi:MAG: alpha-ketoacid dehydrogenase subunit beta [Deltaproteobacteria bacterium]|nr:alpha-ketoacid dehydrogenase subunit beta [Deltaproteobacteria bacterium]
MRELYYGEAIREAVRQEMRADERVYVVGEDVGTYGGVYGISKGLFEEFGDKRVKNTPISEISIVGEAIGASLNGLRPVAEMQFSDFITTAMSTLFDAAAPFYFRIGANLPFVLRCPFGGGQRIGPYHSKCPEAWMFHTPGLKIVAPSTPYDAKGLLIAAIRDPDPVIYFEHKKLYYELKGEVPEESYEVPLGKASIVREGSDITIVSYGWMVHLAREAAKLLEKEGISLEIVDLRSLCPLDEETMLASFKKTNKIIFLHEAWLRGGVGAELLSIICEKAFDYLAAPPIRIGAKNTPVPYSPLLEDDYLPSVQDILEAARKLKSA